jgi:hypothetical protein
MVATAGETIAGLGFLGMLIAVLQGIVFCFLLGILFENY